MSNGVNGSFQKWMLGILGALTTSAIIAMASIVMSVRVAMAEIPVQLEAVQEEQKDEKEELKELRGYVMENTRHIGILLERTDDD